MYLSLLPVKQDNVVRHWILMERLLHCKHFPKALHYKFIISNLTSYATAACFQKATNHYKHKENIQIPQREC